MPESGSGVHATKAEPCCIEGHPSLRAAHLGKHHGATKTNKPLQVASAGIIEELPGQLQPSLGRLGAFWTHVGDAVSGIFWGSLGAVLGASWAILKSLAAVLGLVWGALGLSWGPLWGLLGPPWASLRPSWAPHRSLGPSCVPLGALFGRLEPLSEQFWGSHGPPWAIRELA